MKAMLFVQEDMFLIVDLYGDEDDIDMTKYVEEKNEMKKVEGFFGNPDMLIAEVLDKEESGSTVFNIKGKEGPTISDLGELFKLCLQNGISMLANTGL